MSYGLAHPEIIQGLAALCYARRGKGTIAGPSGTLEAEHPQRRARRSCFVPVLLMTNPISGYGDLC